MARFAVDSPARKRRQAESPLTRLRGLRAHITGSTPGDGFFEASGATYHIEVRRVNEGSVKSTARHRYSQFRALYEEIEESLNLSPFPAWRHICNTAAVRSKREELLPLFINEALERLERRSESHDPFALAAFEALAVFLGVVARREMVRHTI
jgi:hypothetical protein